MSAVVPFRSAIAAAEEKFNSIASQTGNLVLFQREAMFAMQSIEASDLLQKCSRESIQNAVINVASVGLSLSPATKLAYLVPRKGKCCLDISYIGLVKLATDSGAVLAVKAELVREKDDFDYIDAFTSPRHKFNPFDSAETRGNVIGVYVLAKLANGITQVETLSREEIEKIKAVSKASNGPWVDWFEEMAKKAAIKRASKFWPRTERLGKAEEILNEHQGNVTAIQPPAEEVSDDAVKAAREQQALDDAYKAKVREDLTKVKDRAELDNIWTAVLGFCNASQDEEFYNEVKPIVGELRKKFPKVESQEAAE